MSLKLRNIVLISLVLTLLSLSAQIPAHAEVQTSNVSETVDQVVDVISSGLQISSNGIAVTDQSRIVKQLQHLDLSALMKMARAQGVNIDANTEETYVLGVFMKGIDDVNQHILSGEWSVLHRGTIVDADDDGFYLQGGSTYDTIHWWGKTRYLSTYAANKWVSDLNSVANLNATSAVIAGVVFGPIGSVPNGLGAAYCYQLANRAAYYNGLSSRGIKAEITWVLWFSVSTQ